MLSLKRVEEAAPSRRSSIVGQAGVIKELKQLPKSDALDWLSNNIASPVSKDWGRILATLSPEWGLLKTWLRGDKLHAIAALDALDHLVVQHNSLPLDYDIAEVVSEAKRLASEFSSPRVKKAHLSISQLQMAPNLNEQQQIAARLLIGSDNITLRGETEIERWHSLIQMASNRRGCVIMADWKDLDEDLEVELASLARLAEQKGDGLELCVTELDLGGDERVVVVLSSTELSRLREVLPSGFEFKDSTLRPKHD